MEKCFLWNLLLNDCLPDNIYTECEEGRLEGLAEGRAEGAQLQNKENAKKMKAMGLPIENDDFGGIVVTNQFPLFCRKYLFLPVCGRIVIDYFATNGYFAIFVAK